MPINGTAGNDNLIGTGGNDEFDVSQGGDDKVRGQAGDDIIGFGASFDNHDRAYGGDGTDTLALAGDYSGGLTLGVTQLQSIEAIDLSGSFNFTLTMLDSAVVGGAAMTVDASAIAGVHSLTLFAQAESDGDYDVTGSARRDVLELGAGDDAVSGGDGDDEIGAGTGNDAIDGNDGNDTIVFFGAGAFGAGDVVNGGSDDDTLELDGNYSAGLVVSGAMLTSVANVVADVGHDYVLDLSAQNASAAAMHIDATALALANTLIFTATGNVDVAFVVDGGAGDDALTGGEMDDNFTGGAGADTAAGGHGDDIFHIDAVSDSTGPGYDTVVGFDVLHDLFDVGLVDGSNARVTSGKLSINHFNDDMEAIINFTKLGEHDVVLFKPKHGGLAGQWFAVVDSNGVGGYQADADIVIHLVDPVHLAEFSNASFI